MRIKSLIILAAVMLMVSGCASLNALRMNQASVLVEQEKPASSDEAKRPSVSSTSPEYDEHQPADDNDENAVTPYQFLNLMVGNAEEISCRYQVFDCSRQLTYPAAFYKSGDRRAAMFTARDLNGRSITVREVEMDGRVHYIMEEARLVKNYLAPAQDFLIDEMSKAAAVPNSRTYVKDTYRVYEYSVPFAQDDGIMLLYRFYMQKDLLKKLEYYVGDVQAYTYEFTHFGQEVKDEELFAYPLGYHEEWFSYSYSGEHMPPWWEVTHDDKSETMVS